MRKIVICICAFLLAGCTQKPADPAAAPEQPEQTPADTEGDSMGIVFEMDDVFRRLRITWDQSIWSEAELAIVTPEGTELYHSIFHDAYIEAERLLNYACQTSGWYGPVTFRIIARDASGTKGAEEYESEEIIASDWVPEEKQIYPAKDDFLSFSYSRATPGSYVEDPADLKGKLDSFSLYMKEEGTAKLYCTYYNDRGKQKDTEKTLRREEAEEFISLIEDGTLQLDWERDPELIVLDEGNPEKMRCVLKSAKIFTERYYTFVPAGDKKEKIFSWVREHGK